MHVHANQLNPNATLDAVYAAQKAAANQHATQTRKKLMEAASQVAAEADSFVARAGDEDDSPRQQKQQNQPSPQNENAKLRRRVDAEEADEHLSNWA